MTAKAIRQQGGFTLIEVMIVVVIIAILASIAYPAYQEQVRKSRRADAEGTLLQAAQWMERFFTQNNTYVGAVLPASYAQSPQQGTPAYNIAFPAAPAANTYTLQAVPTGPQVGDRCGTLTVDQAGQKGSALAVQECWQ